MELGRREVYRGYPVDQLAAASGEAEANHGVSQVVATEVMVTGMMRTKVTTRPSSLFEPAR